jgi:biopolymer transport protein ExbD
MQLSRPRTPPRLISLVSMIDVLLIMLVFFMVTSTYLNLDMIPMAKSSDDMPNPVQSEFAQASPLMIRLGSDGTPYLRGKNAPPAVLRDRISVHLAQNAHAAVLILPSPRADTQSLVSLMDVLTREGVTNLRILQLAEVK